MAGRFTPGYSGRMDEGEKSARVWINVMIYKIFLDIFFTKEEDIFLTVTP